MKTRLLFSYTTIMFAIINCYGESTYNLSNIEVIPVDNSAQVQDAETDYEPNMQKLWPFELKISRDLDTGSLLLNFRYSFTEETIEDSDTVKVEKVLLISGNDIRPVNGKRAWYTGIVWISDDTIEELKIQEGDIIKVVISAKIKTYEYIYNDVKRDTMIKANSIDFRVQPCPHGTCFRSSGSSKGKKGINGVSITIDDNEQTKDIQCISVTIENEQFKDASIKAFLEETSSGDSSCTFRWEGKKSEVCLNSMASGKDAFPVKVRVIIYEPVTMEYAIKYDAKEISEYAAALKKYLRKESGYYWKLSIAIGILALLGTGAGIWIFTKYKASRNA